MDGNSTNLSDACVQNYTDDAPTNASQSQSWDLSLPRGTVVALTAVFALGVLLSAAGNVTVAWFLIGSGRKKRRTFNAFLLNLAVSDWTLSTLCLPFLFRTTMVSQWKYGDVMCTVIPFTLKVSQIVSIFSLVGIGIDRYRAVMHPLLPVITTPKKMGIVALVWCVAIALASPKLKFLTTVHYTIGDEVIPFCTENWPKTGIMMETYVWALFFLTYLAPMVTLLLCYVRMGAKLLRGKLPGHADARRDKLQKQAKRKALRTLVAVVILFAVCWLPSNLYNIVLISYYDQFFSTHPEVTRTLRACVYIWIILSDAVVNPFVYLFLSDAFERKIKRLKRVCLGRMYHGDDGEVSSRQTTLVTSARTI